jgi:hypothetical protein
VREGGIAAAALAIYTYTVRALKYGISKEINWIEAFSMGMEERYEDDAAAAPHIHTHIESLAYLRSKREREEGKMNGFFNLCRDI